MGVGNLGKKFITGTEHLQEIGDLTGMRGQD
jgi:hypothetical protein